MNIYDLRRAHNIIPPTLKETVTHIASDGTETSTIAWWFPPTERETATSGVGIITDDRVWVLPASSGVNPTVHEKIEDSSGNTWIIQPGGVAGGLHDQEFKCTCSKVKS